MCIVLAIVNAGATAQTFTGSYYAPSEEGSGTTLELVQSGDRLMGTMSSSGQTAKVNGVREGDAMVGTITMGQNGWLRFAAEIDDSVLILTVFPETSPGQPDFESATTFLFERIDSDPAAGEEGGTGRSGVIDEEPDR